MRKRERIKPTLKIIQEYRESNPDLRFVQVLVCLGIIPNFPWMWFHKEENELFKDQNEIPVRDYFLRGTYGKSWKDKLSYRLLSKMSNAHIHNILNDNSGMQKLSDRVESILKDELKYREDRKIMIEE